jgi:hypothetical protein
MSSAADQQFCATSTTLFIKSTSNPATRWTSPGVEVIHGSSLTGVTFFHLQTQQWWTVKNITLEKVYGRLIALTGSNNRIENVRLSWSQRKNCDTGCWQGQSYPWLAAGDNRGGSLLQVNSTTSGTVITGLLGTDCDNNCLTFSGTGSITATVSNTEIFNNDHSSINTGLSAGDGAIRNITFDRLNLHAAASFFHSDNNGATQTLTVTNSLFYDTRAIDDPRMFLPAGRSDPFGIFFEDTTSSTYTIQDSLITTGGHGIRIRSGSLILTRVVIENNAQTGVNANNTANVRIDDSIIANNGSGTVSSSSFQVGCGFTPCTGVVFTSTSNNNKFRHPTGTNFGFLNGINASMSLSEWQAQFGGNASSVTTAACFVSARGFDYNLANDCDDIAANRGPFREIALSERTISSDTLTTTWSVGGTLPLSTCDKAGAVVEYDNVPQTITTCTPAAPLGHATTLAIATPARPGGTIKLHGTYGLVEDSHNIGGFLNARSRAFRDTAITHEGGSGSIPTNWVVGADRPVPAGTDRILIVGVVWEKDTPSSTPPLDITGCTYGGQALTRIADVNVTNGSEPTVLVTAWYLLEAGIAAASSTVLTCTPDESEDAPRPKIVFSGVYGNINQLAPVLNSQTASHATDSTLSTGPLSSTSNPGVAIVIAGAGNNGSWASESGWTEQVDVSEDGSPGTRAFVSDRVTTGDTPAGSATFTTVDSFGNRLGMIAIALNGR